MHRIGGLEKEDGTGNVSYEPENHERMTRLRAAKVAGITDDIPRVDLDADPDADFLLCSWGGTWGVAIAAARRVRARGLPIAHAHLTHLNPFPRDLGEIVARYRRILVPELNLGQLSRLLRAEFLVDVQSYNQVQGNPFKAADVEAKILELMDPPRG
jgi:2-oxoglutarate/2-oxoacid ferredoxin oxidoreductase subunit alpha